MIEKKIRGIIFFSFLLSISFTYSQNSVLHVKSPNGKIDMALESGARILWSVKHENAEVIAPSSISLTLDNGVVLGTNANKDAADYKRAIVNITKSDKLM